MASLYSSFSSRLWLPLLLLQVSADPYTPPSPNKCRNPQTEHYVEGIKKCCRSCPPGFRVLHACTESADTQCESCDEGMYTTAWSRAERCFSCIPSCKAGFVEVKPCTRTQDRCCWCPPDQFCKVKLSQTCFQCSQFQACGKGYGVTKPGTNASDVECAPCGPGTFSDVESRTAACLPHKRCASVTEPGNSTHDAVCGGMTGVATRVTRATHSPHNPARSTNVPLSTPPSKDPMLAVQNEEAPTDLSSKAGWAAGGMFALLVLIAGTLLFVAFRNRDRDCALPFRKDEKLFALIGKGASQQRIPPLNGVDRDGTHVNVNCIVSVCRSGRTSESHPLKGSDPEFRPLAEDEIPLSEEESHHKQTAVEVEDDDTDSPECGEGKLPPLSVQDVGMKSA
nr:PREDICTED: tumor necrosis factor receptor superfamily member 1B [Anolis carolinensis]|eukprot:XP_016854868.1 PREDICTED: tumor necrosis factor receptor superfamily member 1B [Anolis carolinensis]